MKWKLSSVLELPLFVSESDALDSLLDSALSSDNSVLCNDLAGCFPFSFFDNPLCPDCFGFEQSRARCPFFLQL